MDPTSSYPKFWDPYQPPYYTSVFPVQHVTTSRPMSCQMTQTGAKSDGQHDAQADETADDRRPRSYSMRLVRDRERTEAPRLRRSSSSRLSLEAANSLTSELSDKSSHSKGCKVKGPKFSLFSKIFGRKKKPPPPTEAASGTGTRSTKGNTTPKEYVTFSGQFPPPEWVWYRQQLQKHKVSQDLTPQQPYTSVDPRSDALAQPPPLSERYDSLQTFKTEPICPPALYHRNYPQPVMACKYSSRDYVNVPETDAPKGKAKTVEKLQHRMKGSQAWKIYNQNQRRHNQPYPVHDQIYYNGMQGNHNGVVYAHQPAMDTAVPTMHTQQSCDDSDTCSLSSCRTQYSMPYKQRPAKLAVRDRARSVGSKHGFSQNKWSIPVYTNHGQQDQVNDSRYYIRRPTAEAGNVGPLYYPNDQLQHEFPHQTDTNYQGRGVICGSDVRVEYEGRMYKRNTGMYQSRDSGVNTLGIDFDENESGDTISHPVPQNTHCPSQQKQQYYEKPIYDKPRNAMRCSYSAQQNNVNLPQNRQDTISITQNNERNPLGFSQNKQHMTVNVPHSREQNSVSAPQNRQLQTVAQVHQQGPKSTAAAPYNSQSTEEKLQYYQEAQRQKSTYNGQEQRHKDTMVLPEQGQQISWMPQRQETHLGILSHKQQIIGALERRPQNNEGIAQMTQQNITRLPQDKEQKAMGTLQNQQQADAVTKEHGKEATFNRSSVRQESGMETLQQIQQKTLELPQCKEMCKTEMPLCGQLKSNNISEYNKQNTAGILQKDTIITGDFTKNTKGVPELIKDSTTEQQCSSASSENNKHTSGKRPQGIEKNAGELSEHAQQNSENLQQNNQEVDNQDVVHRSSPCSQHGSVHPAEGKNSEHARSVLPTPFQRQSRLPVRIQQHNIMTKSASSSSKDNLSGGLSSKRELDKDDSGKGNANLLCETKTCAEKVNHSEASKQIKKECMKIANKQQCLDTNHEELKSRQNTVDPIVLASNTNSKIVTHPSNTSNSANCDVEETGEEREPSVQDQTQVCTDKVSLYTLGEQRYNDQASMSNTSMTVLPTNSTETEERHPVSSLENYEVAVLSTPRSAEGRPPTSTGTEETEEKSEQGDLTMSTASPTSGQDRSSEFFTDSSLCDECLETSESGFSSSRDSHDSPKECTQQHYRCSCPKPTHVIQSENGQLLSPDIFQLENISHISASNPETQCLERNSLDEHPICDNGMKNNRNGVKHRTSNVPRTKQCFTSQYNHHSPHFQPLMSGNGMVSQPHVNINHIHDSCQSEWLCGRFQDQPLCQIACMQQLDNQTVNGDTLMPEYGGDFYSEQFSDQSFEPECEFEMYGVV